MGFGESLGVGEWLVIGLSVLIGAWFLIGSWINNQRSLQAMRWLKHGLTVFGEPGRSQLSMPESKGIRFKLDAPAQAPLMNVAGILNLERRENLPLWAFELLRGKRDTLLLTADTRHIPDGELRAFHSSNLSQVEAAKQGKTAALTFLCQEGEMHLYARGEASPDMVSHVSRLIQKYPMAFREIIFQKKSPQISLQMRLGSLLSHPAEEFFRNLEKLF